MSYTMYTPLNVWLDPASVTDVVAYIQTYLLDNPIYSQTEIETLITSYLTAHPELIGVQSVNGKTGTVVLSASDITTENDVTIESALASLSSQISSIAASVATNTNNITSLTGRVSTAETDISDLKRNLTNEATARANADTALGNRITSLQGAVGSPLVAATASAMTDNSKIYVYTGSESGYTNGNWYYYNGSAWVSGGVYNAVAINTDKTLTVSDMAADAKVTGDSLDDLKDVTDYLTNTQSNNIYDLDTQQIYTPWEQGAMDGGSGQPLDDRLTNIRSKDYIYLDSGVYKFACPSTDRFYLFRYALDKSYTDAPVWGRNSDYYLSVTSPIYIKMVEAHTNGTNISPSDALVVVNREITKLASTISSVRILDDIIYGLGKNKIKPSQILNLENYSINDGGINRTANVRYLSQLFIEFPTSLILVPKTNAYQYGFYTYNSDGTGGTGSGWKTGVQTEFIANSLYSINFIKAGSQAGEQLTIAEIDNAFSFVIKTQIKQKNKRVFCVSHQGNTSINSNNHNKAEGYKNAKICGFEYAETDLKYTSDGVLVCCHDTTFEDATTGETVQISNTTLANLKTHNYYGGTIATLSEILSVCKTYGLKLFIDQIGTTTYANALISVLNKMRAWEDVIINIGYNETTIANTIITANKNATLAVVSSSATLTDLITFATSIKTDDNKVYISANVSQLPIANIETLNESIPSNIGLTVWMLDTVANVLNYLPYINGYTTNLISYDDVYNSL